MDSNKVNKATLVLVCILVAIQIIKIVSPFAMWFQKQRFIEPGNSLR